MLIVVILVFLATEIPLMVITVLHTLHQRLGTGVPCHRETTHGHHCPPHPAPDSSNLFLITEIPLMVITVLHTLHQRYSTVVPCHRDTTHFFRCTYCSIPFIIYNTLQQLQLPLHGLREGPGHHPHSERAALLQLPPQLCHLLRHEQV